MGQADRGFRKTRIFNRCVPRTTADYLEFIDGDSAAQPDFVVEDRRAATPGAYQNGDIIRLDAALSDAVTRAGIDDDRVFDARWLRRTGGGWNRRYLKVSLPLGLRELEGNAGA